MADVEGRVETVLPASAASPSVARRFVAAGLRRWGVDESIVETATLLISEVVTNAVVHAASEVRVALQRRGSSVRIEVSDRGEGVPMLVPPDLERLDGRGLAIVDRLATAWGSTPRSAGKAVWFDLDV